MHKKPLSEVIVDCYIQRGIIKPEMRPIYVYGAWLIINDIISFSVILILSALIGEFFSGVIFLAVFYILRLSSGGFHAKKVWICRLTMTAVFFGVTALAQLIYRLDIMLAVIPVDIISVLMMLPVIPVENPNKRLTPKLRRRNKRNAVITALVFCVISLVLSAMGRIEGVIISATLLSVAVLAVIGKKANTLNERSDINEQNSR